jgi:hypothetical protein
MVPYCITIHEFSQPLEIFNWKYNSCKEDNQNENEKTNMLSLECGTQFLLLQLHMTSRLTTLNWPIQQRSEMTKGILNRNPKNP